MGKLYSRLVGSHRKGADLILKERDKILQGTMIAIDPGSNSLGFSFFRAGELVKSGTIKAKGSVAKRLSEMVEELQEQAELSQMWPPDVTLVEFVRSNTGHIYLTWAAGAAVGALASPVTIEVVTGAWKKNVPTTYVKSDENDAIEIGRYAVTLCVEGITTKGRRRANPKLRTIRRYLARKPGRDPGAG